MSRSTQRAIAADFVFDGSRKYEDAAVVIDGTHIVSVVPKSKLPRGMSVDSAPPGSWLVPGFIDLQVNGGGDVLFNNSPTRETIATLVAAHRKFGTTALLPTLITDTEEKMRAAMAAAESMVGNEPGVLGIHLEGPYLSPDKAGVHDPKFIRRPGPSDLEMLCADRRGALLVTLAPERVPRGFIQRLARSGARVALGHSMATYEETCAAMAEGLSGFTHLFNAMRPFASREPGPIAAALESSQSWFGMIVDGFHVHPAMLRLALRGLAHPMLVTDSMPPVGGHRTSFDLYGLEVQAVGGRCLRPDGTLSGALLDMGAAVRNCVNFVQTSLEDALRFASRNPAEFLGMGHLLGTLGPGYRADMVAIDPGTLSVQATWVAGSGDCSGP
jgi:N-acetylglucosamine-6-phosphate deacetylase